jgi:hypothetical protein
MSDYLSEKLLILTKTYPIPSQKYRETSCIAAINQNGKLRRLYPIPFRLLDGNQQFQRWEWIRARLKKTPNDHRIESYKVDLDSIERLSRVGTDADWAERYQWLEAHIVERFEDLEVRRQNSGETLGLIHPKNFELIISKVDNPDWTRDEKDKLIQDGLFDSPEVRSRIPLRKVPYDFYYEYACQTKTESCNHKHKINDWEVGALYWTCQKKYGTDWEKFFRQKLETEFADKKDLLFLMGTIHRFPDQWLIVGLVYPPKVQARQRSLHLVAPDV